MKIAVQGVEEECPLEGAVWELLYSGSSYVHDGDMAMSENGLLHERCKGLEAALREMAELAVIPMPDVQQDADYNSKIDAILTKALGEQSETPEEARQDNE